MHMNRWILTFFLILLVGSSWLWISRVPVDAQPQARAPQPAVDHPAPPFTLTTLDGESFTLRERPETPIVLNFWATWCGPCRNEMPALQAAADRLDGQVQFVAVDQAESAAVVQQFVDEFGLSLTIPMDTENEVADRYQVTGLPTTFFIDRNGVIQRIWMGEMNPITIAEGVAEILP